MFGVCLFYESGGEWENQWAYLIRHFSPDKIYIIGDTLPETKPFKDALLIENVAELPNSTPIVLLSPENARYYSGRKNLRGFNHPEDAIYVFGPDSAYLTKDYFEKRKPEHKVYILTDTDDDMYSWIAGAITFYDRRYKWLTK